MTAEEFLIEKLTSQICSFGEGIDEFHTRDIEHLLKCLEAKNHQTASLRKENEELKRENERLAKSLQNSEVARIRTIVNNSKKHMAEFYMQRNYRMLYECYELMIKQIDGNNAK